MRAIRILIAAVALTASVSSVRGGIYFTQSFSVLPPDLSLPEELEWQPNPSNLQQFEVDMRELYAASLPVNPGQLRSRYLRKANELERRAHLDLNDRINLGAYYLRLGEPEKAVQAMSPAEAEGRTNFQFLANLATAHHRAQRLDRAVALQQQVIDNFPSSWPGYTTQELSWLRKSEELYLQLLKLRYTETLRPREGEETVDALFPRVRFVGPDGHYAAGQLAPEQWARIPADAVSQVEQLLLWDPNDKRLYWLLGELLNAGGNILPAYGIMDDLVYKQRYSPKELNAHRQTLLKTIDLLRKTDNNYVPFIYWSLVPRASMLSPGAGLLAGEMAPALRMELMRLENEKRRQAAEAALDKQPLPETARTDKGAPPAPWLPDWRTVTVSFLAGGLFALLMGLQYQEIRRRQQRRLEARSPTSTPSSEHAEQTAERG